MHFSCTVAHLILASSVFLEHGAPVITNYGQHQVIDGPPASVSGQSQSNKASTSHKLIYSDYMALKRQRPSSLQLNEILIRPKPKKFKNVVNINQEGALKQKRVPIVVQKAILKGQNRPLQEKVLRHRFKLSRLPLPKSRLIRMTNADIPATAPVVAIQEERHNTQSPSAFTSFTSLASGLLRHLGIASAVSQLSMKMEQSKAKLAQLFAKSAGRA